MKGTLLLRRLREICIGQYISFLLAHCVPLYNLVYHCKTQYNVVKHGITL